MKRFDVVFLPSGRRGKVDEGLTIREAAQLLGEGIESVCGGKGSCGKCKIRILEGSEHGVNSTLCNLSAETEAERLLAQRFGFQRNERLACQARVNGHLAIFIPEESRPAKQIILKPSGIQNVDVVPTIRKYVLDKSLITIDSASGPKERILAEIKNGFNLSNLTIDDFAFDNWPDLLEKTGEDITVTIWNDAEIIRIELARNEKAFGLAVDIGTTTIGLYLCDLITGEVLATESMMNPQIQYGEDIMTRISYAKSNANGLAELNTCIIDALNKLIRSITHKANLLPSDILETVIVGNTVMHHIFLGLDIEPLGLWPFKPELSNSVDKKARELGLNVLPSSNVHVLPIEAGFVGADNVGVLIAEEPYNQDDILLIIDIGTNGELVLGNRQRLVSASCATGPAFEGANIKFGMRAALGAIDRVRIDQKTLDLRFTVIGDDDWNTETSHINIKACGICGSGIIDTVAELFLAGILMKSGSFNKTINSPRLRFDQENKPEFVIAWANETAIDQNITITQKDVRAIQLAKAAVHSGAQLMLRRLNLEYPDKVILAGAFGTVIDQERALAIGMFPKVGIEDIYSIGNAAGDGARIALLNKNKRLEASRIAREVEYIELTESPGFNEAFIGATHFPSE